MENEFILADKIRDQLFSTIQKTMEKEEISQGEVARRIGAKRYNINKVMRKKSAVSVDFLLKMAESIGLDVELKTRFKK
jgi:predicted XRE-type DNA-binding protein